MSELALTDWAEPEVMAQYRAKVKDANDAWLALHPAAKRRLELRKPEQCAHALCLLDDQAVTQREIAKATGLNDWELGQLIFRNPELWETRKKRLAAKAAQTAEDLVDLARKKAAMLAEDEDELAKTPIKDIALAYGIINDKAASLNGEAATVIEHRTGPTIDAAMAFREEVRKRIADKAKEEAIDV